MGLQIKYEHGKIIQLLTDDGKDLVKDAEIETVHISFRPNELPRVIITAWVDKVDIAVNGESIEILKGGGAPDRRVT